MGIEASFFTTFGGRIKIRPTNTACWDFGEGIGCKKVLFAH